MEAYAATRLAITMYIDHNLRERHYYTSLPRGKHTDDPLLNCKGNCPSFSPACYPVPCLIGHPPITLAKPHSNLMINFYLNSLITKV